MCAAYVVTGESIHVCAACVVTGEVTCVCCMWGHR